MRQGTSAIEFAITAPVLCGPDGPEGNQLKSTLPSLFRNPLLHPILLLDSISQDRNARCSDGHNAYSHGYEQLHSLSLSKNKECATFGANERYRTFGSSPGRAVLYR